MVIVDADLFSADAAVFRYRLSVFDKDLNVAGNRFARHFSRFPQVVAFRNQAGQRRTSDNVATFLGGRENDGEIIVALLLFTILRQLP